MSEKNIVIEIKKLNKRFGSLHVLKDEDLVVKESEVVVLIGASGSGKSTLLRCINFLEMKESGDVYLEGNKIDPQKDDLNKVRMRTGMVFQHFNLFPHMTVMENVIEAPVQVKKMNKGEAVQIGKELLAKVGLARSEEHTSELQSRGHLVC